MNSVDFGQLISLQADQFQQQKIILLSVSQFIMSTPVNPDAGLLKYFTATL
jgi:hypothetical protein